MEVFMTSSELKSYCTKRLLISSVILATLFAIVYSLLSYLQADILYKESFWRYFLEYFSDIVRSLFFSLLFGYFLYVIYRLGVKRSVSTFFVILEILMYHHLSLTIALAIPNAAWSMDRLYPSVIFELYKLITEIALLLAFALLCLLILWLFRGNKEPIIWKRPFEFRHTFKICVLIGCILWFTPELRNRILLDQSQFKSPENFADWLSFFWYWFSCIFIFVILPYLSMLFIADKADSSKIKAL